MNLHLDIVTPEKTVFSGRVSFVYLPGVEGELGILPGHVPLVTALEPGELRYGSGGEIQVMAVGSGFVEVTGAAVTVMTDMALDEHEIDESSVAAALERAQQELSRIDHDADAEDIAALQAVIAKSTAVLRVKRKGGKGAGNR
jgi:F-type H+-transporting ATPase subunit epsilon